MSFNLADLPDYIDQTREGLIGKVIGGAKSARILDMQTGFKSSGAINRIDTDANFQDGSGCGFNADGNTKLDQRILTVGEIKVQESLCPRELNKKYTQHQLKAGSNQEEIPFAEAYTKLKVAKINQKSEKAIWQGDTASGDANLNKFDGLIKIIDAEATVIDGNVGAETAITEATVRPIVMGMYNSIPADLLEAEMGEKAIDDLAVMCGTDVFRTYATSLMNANLFHYNPEHTVNELVIPTTNVKLIAVGGLTGTDRLFAGRIGSDGDFVVGTDLEHEEEEFKMRYSEDNDDVRFSTRWKMGTQIKFPEQIVQFTLSV